MKQETTLADCVLKHRSCSFEEAWIKGCAEFNADMRDPLMALSMEVIKTVWYNARKPRRSHL